MIGSWRVFLGALITGTALTAFGCFASPQANGETFGQGGTATTVTAGTGGDVPCSPTSPCEDDGNPCTVEVCANGVCARNLLTQPVGPGSTDCLTNVCSNGVSTPKIHDKEACGDGGKLKCVGQVCTGCADNGACGTTDDCKTSTCEKDKACTYMHKPFGTSVAAKLPDDEAGDCMGTICDGAGAIILFTDATDVPVNLPPCTEGHCVDGKPEQAPSALGTACADGVTFCNSLLSCVACATDANCGAGKTCYVGDTAQCVSCSDSTKNGTEADVDCGGTCVKKCTDGKDCKGNGDCASGLCSSGKCIGCSDGIQNNGEGGVDCGGPCAVKCKDGTPCTNNASDCDSGDCVDGFCCDTVCNGTCTACNIAMKEGTCSPLAKGHDDANPMCSGNMTCTTGGNCVSDGGKKHFGEACMMGSQCFNGICDGQPSTCK